MKGHEIEATMVEFCKDDQKLLDYLHRHCVIEFTKHCVDLALKREAEKDKDDLK